MKKATTLFALGILIILFSSGCYMYTSDPLPAPVIIVPDQVTPPPQQQQTKPEPPPAPVGPPAGAVGPPQS